MSSEKIREFNRASLEKIAREIVIRRYVLILHIWVYIFANLILFIINYRVNFNYPWFLWPLTGWAVALLTHGFVFFVYRKGVVNGNTIAILYHGFFFAIINLLLFFIASFTATPRWTIAWWFIWPLIGWGILFTAHLVVYFYIIPKRDEENRKGWLERKIDSELQKLQDAQQKMNTKNQENK